jgi:hypothetical protein
MMSIIAFVLFAWTAATWFSLPYGKPFLGLPIFSVNPLIPFAITLVWSLGSGLHWLIRRRGAMRIRMDLEKLLKEQRTAALILGGILLFHLVVVSVPAVLNYRGENDSDSALYGVAGYHIAAGTEQPMFSYGLHYVGSLKTHVTALFNFLFGKSPIYHRAIAALLYCFFLVGLFLFVRRLFNEKTALTAAALAALPPFAVAAQLRYEEFIEIPLWGIISLNLLLSITHEKKENRRCYFWYGVVLGLLFFAHPQAVYFIVTGIIVLFAADKLFFIRKQGWLIPLGFVIGTTPTWVDSYFHDWVIFKYFFGSEIQAAPDLIPRISSGVVRFYHNFTEFWGLGDTFPMWFPIRHFFVAAIMAAAAGGFFYYVYISRKEIAAFLTLKNYPMKRLILLILAVLIFAVYTISVKASLFGPFRYIFPLWFVIPVVIAAAAVMPESKIARGLGTGFLVITLALFSLSYISYYKASRDRGNEWKEWLVFCKERDITHFYGDFWLAYQTNFISKEEITGSSCFPWNYDPYMKYRERVDHALKPPAYVFSPQSWQNAPRKAAKFEESLEYLGIRYKKEVINQHIVFYDLSEFLTPAQLKPLQLLNEVTYKSFSVREIVGDESVNDLRLVTVDCLNSGKTVLYADGTRGFAEFVVSFPGGTVLRRQPLARNVEPGEPFSCRALLGLEELAGVPVHLQVKLNDIIISAGKQPLVIYPANLETGQGNSPPMTVSDLNSRLKQGSLPEFIFSSGWGKRDVQDGQIIQWSGGKQSEILFLVKNPGSQTAGIILELAAEPFFDESFKGSHQVLEFGCNNHPVDGRFPLKGPGKIRLELSGTILRVGINRLVIRPRLVEPECRRISKDPGFAFRPRAFAIRSIALSGKGN